MDWPIIWLNLKFQLKNNWMCCKYPSPFSVRFYNSPRISSHTIVSSECMCEMKVSHLMPFWETIHNMHTYMTNLPRPVTENSSQKLFNISWNICLKNKYISIQLSKHTCNLQVFGCCHAFTHKKRPFHCCSLRVGSHLPLDGLSFNYYTCKWKTILGVNEKLNSQIFYLHTTNPHLLCATSEKVL